MAGPSNDRNLLSSLFLRPPSSYASICNLVAANTYIILPCRRCQFNDVKIDVIRSGTLIDSHLDESANIERMDYSGRAGGSIGVGRVLVLQTEDGQRTFKIYATNYSILQYEYWM